MTKLVQREMDFLAIRAENKFGINLLWDEKILSTLAKGYDCRYGVRSIKHEVERQIVTPLALAHQSGELPLGTIHILRHHFLRPVSENVLH